MAFHLARSLPGSFSARARSLFPYPPATRPNSKLSTRTVLHALLPAPPTTAARCSKDALPFLCFPRSG